MTVNAWSFYKLSTGKITGITNGIKPRNVDWLAAEGLGVVAGHYDDQYYVDTSELQTVPIYRETELGFFLYDNVLFDELGAPITSDDPHRKPLTRDHIQPTPKPKTASPLVDPAPIAVNEEFVINVGPETEIELFDTEGNMQGADIVTDGILELSYTVPGSYTVMIAEVVYLPVTLTVEVME